LVLVDVLITRSILAFLAGIFYFSADLSPGSSDEKKMMDGLRFSIGFGAANALFSAIAYFFIEPLDPKANPFATEGDEDTSDTNPIAADEQKDQKGKKKKRRVVHGRRALLLISLSCGTVMLFILTFLLRLDKTNPAKLPLVMIFIILFTLFYSPGAGAVPFLYSAEVWPNEGRGKLTSWSSPGHPHGPAHHDYDTN
jgi:MFS family permease